VSHQSHTLTPRGVFACAGHEGVVPCRYFDMVGVPTIYIGHTDKAGPPRVASVPLAMPRSRQELDAALDSAFDVFENDLRAYAAEIDAFFGPMKPWERDGWTHWHFNTGGAHSSSAVRKWRSGDKAGAVQVMQSWNKVTVDGRKVVSSALKKRRAEEAKTILRGIYPTREVPVWPTDGEGNVIWRSIDLLDFDEVQRLAKRAEPGTFFDRLWRALGWRRWFSFAAQHSKDQTHEETRSGRNCGLHAQRLRNQ